MIAVPGPLIVCAVLLAGAAEPSPVNQIELSTLTGRKVAGVLKELSADHLSVDSKGHENRVPLAEVLEVRTLRAKAVPPADMRRPDLTLTDGSRIFWSVLRIADRQISAKTLQLGNLKVPATVAGSIRFAPLDPVITDAWKDLSSREVTQDMLVIRKGSVLDHLDGTVGAVDDSKIRFVLEGEEHSISREKIFGIVYSRRNADAGKAICELSTVSGDLLKAQSATWSGNALSVALLGGTSLAVPGTEILSIDFSSGKVRYLSQIEPREVKYTPFFDQVWTYCRDHPRDGGSLRIGDKEYARGLWIHSRTLLKYRLNGDYRRFQAVMGIDRAVAPLGNVHVVISGDGKTLLEQDVRGSDAPQNLDLDVAGIRDLEILVDFGGDLDIADHLDLADARVIK